ncbi:hypothetical protein CFE_2588 [Carboxydocella thermautotrophica]|uniref:Uncharacterized protein n=1 Tax=Carboxydocella thermautotrophica TaxID=178899 RepID=A0A2R4N413_CARTR|nr:hypothetical protein CFE_2588 [Carboxydocella thermautotrophica]AVX32142.1 hypothetical protein CTH_2603 [Carboxydocella thermautotrophica]
MGTYDKQFKNEAVRLSDEVGVKKSGSAARDTILYFS